MTGRLIDADELKRHIPATSVDIFENCINCRLLDDFQVVYMIDKMPTVDAVPVVRCRECKHCDPENHHCDHHMGTAAPLRRKPDDFCSYGERKEVADNPTIKNEMEAKEE